MKCERCSREHDGICRHCAMADARCAAVEQLLQLDQEAEGAAALSVEGQGLSISCCEGKRAALADLAADLLARVGPGLAVTGGAATARRLNTDRGQIAASIRIAELDGPVMLLLAYRQECQVVATVRPETAGGNGLNAVAHVAGALASAARRHGGDV